MKTNPNEKESKGGSTDFRRVSSFTFSEQRRSQKIPVRRGGAFSGKKKREGC